MNKILIAMTMFLPMASWAFTGEAVVEGINYYIVTKAKTAEVRAFPYSWEISDIPKYKGNIVIPESIVYEGVECSVTSIGNAAFSSCNELNSVVIPNSVTAIGNNAFENCSSLISLTIPNSVSSIGAFAFSSCSGLTSITIGESVTSIDEDAFENCSSLTSLVIPNSVMTIGNQAFRGCSSLTSIMIGNGVIQIGMEAFENCTSLTTLTIGGGVKKIFYHAFANCPELADVYCLAEEVPATIYSDRFSSSVTDTFENSYIEYATLHVPSSSIEAYRSKAPWNGFKNIVEYVDPSGIQGVNLDKSVNTPAYDLNGRRLTKTAKGINIIGGKKVVVK